MDFPQPSDTPRLSKVHAALDTWKGQPLWRHVVTHRVLSAAPAHSEEHPPWIDPRLVDALVNLGMKRLYKHQIDSARALQDGGDVVIATPTASGKSLCYSLPVFNALLADRGARALYLFPTKALARDQVESARRLARALGQDAAIGVAVYDGDTPPDQRRSARRKARIVATNPDMLHAGILPHHTYWAEFFSGLRYIVIDELHTYRGVFGSHVANVLRRLLRIAAFHGAHPQFVATSATIANPGDLAARLFGRQATVIDESGAPSGERHFVLYNPPLIDPALGIRQSYLKATTTLTRYLVNQGLRTLVFTNSRVAVEVLVRYLRDTLDVEPRGTRPPRDRRPLELTVRGYRGGYLPDRRRGVEHAMRAGQTDVVVATSALELGIDIGALDAVVLAGWPGSRASAWQRAGRAGRRLDPSLTVLVASSEPVDQFVANDADYLFGQAPEHARADPDNVSILVPHVKCAAFELPFIRGEPFGDLPGEETGAVLDYLADNELIHRSSGDRFHYLSDAYPANDVSLRGPLDENFLVIEQPRAIGTDHPVADVVIAEVDYRDATEVLHQHAIYQLEGRQYEVLRLDHESHKAYVQRISVDYYTQAMTHLKVRILETLQAAPRCQQGEVHLLSRVVGFKKIKLHTHENIGYGDVDEPDREMHSSAVWFDIEQTRGAAAAHSPAEVAEAALALAYSLHSAAALLLMSTRGDLGHAVGDARSGWFSANPHSVRGLTKPSTEQKSRAETALHQW